MNSSPSDDCFLETKWVSLDNLPIEPSPTGPWAKRSVVIRFQLMPYRQDGDCLVVVDFEQCDIPQSAKWNDQLPQERVVRSRFPVAEWREFQTPDAILMASRARVASDQSDWSLARMDS